MLFSELQSKIENAPDLDFGVILNESIELFKKVWLQGLLANLITLACAIPIMFIIYIPLMIFGLSDASNPENFEGLGVVASIILFMAYAVAIFLMSVLSFGIQAAFFRIVANKDLNVMEADDYFFFLKKPFLPKTIKIAVITIAISFIAALLCLIPLIYAIVPLSFFPVIYAFNHQLSASNIMKASFELGNKKWLITFGLLIVAGLLAQIVGLILCVIGIFVTASFAKIPAYIIYKKVCGVDTSEVDQIGVQTV